MIIYEDGEQFNVPSKWLVDHDKQIIENTFTVLNQALKDLGQDRIPRFILDCVADKVKGEQKNELQK